MVSTRTATGITCGAVCILWFNNLLFKSLIIDEHWVNLVYNVEINFVDIINQKTRRAATSAHSFTRVHGLSVRRVLRYNIFLADREMIITLCIPLAGRNASDPRHNVTSAAKSLHSGARVRWAIDSFTINDCPHF